LKQSIDPPTTILVIEDNPIAVKPAGVVLKTREHVVREQGSAV
jgi:hypothetical protein